MFKQNNSKEDFSFHERLRTTIHQIHIVQSTDSIMRLLAYYQTIKKDKMFSQIKRKIEDSWELIMNDIMHQPEEDFLNHILNNLQIGQTNSKNVN